jgi:hypothetical protein
MKRILLAAVAFLTLSSPAALYGAKQVACPKVISELNKVSRSEENRVLAMEKVAKRLDTSAVWVENCMRMYGRTVPRQIRIDQDQREELLERMEERDLAPEDVDPEDRQQPDPVREPEPESAGYKKRKPNEHIQRQQYLPQ